MKIGFIGLGNMGAPMAANLIKAGHEVTGFDVAGVTAEGAANAGSAAEAAIRPGCGDHHAARMARSCATVYAEIVPAGAKGSVFIDCSTVDVESARAAHEMAAAYGLLSVDAPVSGGVGGAARRVRSPSWPAAATRRSARAAPLFEIMGQKAVHCGAAGAGQSAKICNNMLLGISMIGACEAFALAEKLGSVGAEPVRCGVDLVGLLLVGQHLLPGAGRRSAEPGRQWLQTRVCR